MSMGSNSMHSDSGDYGDHDDGLMGEINMTPLVDVMLVLLVIFLVTLPVIQHAVKVDLPQASSQPVEQKTVHIQIAIAADGALSWDGKPLPEQELPARLAEAAKQSPQPELQLYADRHVVYEKVADLMSAAQSSGLSKLAFVTTVPHAHSP
jgi:biopolymer transport protein ExbD